jgi:hypothetical protein
MAQHDFNIANQSFPSFRTDLNNALSAINTSQSGTSRPSGAVAGTIWLDTTSATTPTLKYYDGADDISLATLDHSANTVNWLDSTVSVTGLTTTATGTVLTLSDSSLTSSVNLILENQKEIRFSETTANGVNYVGFKAPASLSADKIWVLPSADGTAGQFLKTDGAGNLSFDSLSFSTPLAVIGNATAGSEIRLPEDTDNGSNYVAIKAPNTIASNLTLTLPSADGTSGQVLQTNGSGVLSFAGVSGGLSEVDMWRITANTTATASSFLTANWERIDVSPEGTSGTGMTESSGVFTFPSTGYWFVSFQLSGFANSGPALFIGPEIHATTNNSTYVQLTSASGGNWDNAAEDTLYTSTILNISDTANRKVKFYYSQGISENRIRGNTSYTATGATFIKLI